LSIVSTHSQLRAGENECYLHAASVESLEIKRRFFIHLSLVITVYVVKSWFLLVREQSTLQAGSWDLHLVFDV
jgi:hypothetical protein